MRCKIIPITLLVTLVQIPAYGQKADIDDPIKRETILLRLARNATNAGWYDKAIIHYREYLSVRQLDQAARSELAGLLLKTGQKDASVKEYQELIRQQPQQEKWLFSLADAALTEPEPDQRPDRAYLQIAQETLRQALTLKEDQRTRKKLAQVHSWMGEYAEVLEVLRPAGQLQLNEIELCRAFAEAISLTSQHTAEEVKSVVRLADQAIKKSIRDVKLCSSLARAMRKLEQPDKAVRLFETALQETPQNRKVRYELANLLHNLERYTEAEKHYTIMLDDLEATKNVKTNE